MPRAGEDRDASFERVADVIRVEEYVPLADGRVEDRVDVKDGDEEDIALGFILILVLSCTSEIITELFNAEETAAGWALGGSKMESISL